MGRLSLCSLALATLLFFHVEILERLQWASDQAEPATGALLGRAIGPLLGVPSIVAFCLFSRIDESRALENASRQRLREAIRSAPGSSLSELSQRVGLGWGTTVYHLNRMERVGLVASADVGRRRAFFLKETAPKLQDLASLRINGAQERLLEALRGQPGASQQELAKAAGIGAPLAHRYLRRLEETGLVRSTKEWKVRRYAATDRLRAQWSQETQGPMSPTPSGPLPLLPALSLRGTNAG
jgi:predicted transcriptional regulator